MKRRSAPISPDEEERLQRRLRYGVRSRISRNSRDMMEVEQDENDETYPDGGTTEGENEWTGFANEQNVQDISSDYEISEEREDLQVDEEIFAEMQVNMRKIMTHLAGQSSTRDEVESSDTEEEHERSRAPRARNPQLVMLQRNVRVHLARLLNEEDRNPSVPSIPTREEVAVLEQGGEGVEVSLENFRVDLEGNPTSLWNRVARRVFVADFIDSGFYACKNEQQIGDVFVARFKYLRSKYKRAQKDITPTLKLLDKSIKSRDQRRRNLWIRRLNVVKEDPHLQHHLPVLEALGPEGMSSDASDHYSDSDGEVIHGYNIHPLPWRATEVQQWLRELDNIHLRKRLSPFASMTRGKLPHPRHPDADPDTKSDRTAVRGLPRNFYRPSWLATLAPIYLSEMLVQDSLHMLTVEGRGLPGAQGREGSKGGKGKKVNRT